METFIFYNYLKRKKDTKNDTINKIMDLSRNVQSENTQNLG